MKLNNSAPLAPLAAGLLIATMTGCSDYELQNLKGGGEDEQNPGATNPNPIGDLAPTEATPNTDDEPPPPDAPPSLPGSSLFENTCFGLLSEDSLAPLDEETDDYYMPVLDWMDRTRLNLGIDLFQRLRGHDPEMVDARMQEYAENGVDPTIELATEAIRDLLVEKGVTVWWMGYEPLEESEWPGVYLTVGDRREDIERALEEFPTENPWLIPDISCYGVGSTVYLQVNKIAPEDWNHPELRTITNFSGIADRIAVSKEPSQTLATFRFLSADEGYCPPPENELGMDVHDVNGGYEFPWGTVCFEDDSGAYEGQDFSSGMLLGQTTEQRLDHLRHNTRTILGAIAGGRWSGQAYFEGSWFEE